MEEVSNKKMIWVYLIFFILLITWFDSTLTDGATTSIILGVPLEKGKVHLKSMDGVRWWVKWISTKTVTPPTGKDIFTITPPSRLPTSQQLSKPHVKISKTGLVEKLSLKDLTIRATTILIGTVADVKCLWDAKRTNIFTFVTISVQQYIKGDEKDRMITIKIRGGKIGEVIQWVEDTPNFRKGEKILLFLQPKYFRIVGRFQGKYTIEQDVVMGLDISVDDFNRKIKNILMNTSEKD